MVVEENGLAVKCKRGSGEEYVVENIYGEIKHVHHNTLPETGTKVHHHFIKKYTCAAHT